MSDTPTPSGPELKQSRTVGKSSGAKDAKALKHNPNRDLQAPEMPDAEKELSVIDRLGGRGHGAKPARTIQRMLDLAEKGYSQVEIAKKLRVAEKTVYNWLQEPDLEQDFKDAYRRYVDNEARKLVPMASRWGEESESVRILLERGRRLSRLKGLDPKDKVTAHDRALQREIDAQTATVNAQDKKFHRILQVAGRQMPSDWGERADGESTMVVLDVSLGIIKEFNPPGSPDGQNVKALESGRWGQKQLPDSSSVGGET